MDRYEEREDRRYYNEGETALPEMVWPDERYLSRRAYNIVIGLTLLWGIALNIAMAGLLGGVILKMPYWAAAALYFVLSLAGMFIAHASRDAMVSFVGFTIMSLGMGLLITYYVQFFAIGLVVRAFIATACVVGSMTIAATLFPQFFGSLGGVLGCTLGFTLLAELVMWVLRLSTPFDMVYILIFCGYTGYDWARAQRHAPTLDNAVDSAADIYVDIMNLFVRILSAMARREGNGGSRSSGRSRGSSGRR